MGARPRQRKPCAENEVEETVFKLLEPFSEDVVDDDAALVRKSPSDENDAGRNLLRKHLPRLSPMREEILALKPRRKA